MLYEVITELRHGLAERGAVKVTGTANPHTRQEGDDCRGSPGKAAEDFAGTGVNRQRTVDALLDKILHEAEKKGQVVGPDPPSYNFV